MIYIYIYIYIYNYEFNKIYTHLRILTETYTSKSPLFITNYPLSLLFPSLIYVRTPAPTTLRPTNPTPNPTLGCAVPLSLSCTPLLVPHQAAIKHQTTHKNTTHPPSSPPDLRSLSTSLPLSSYKTSNGLRACDPVRLHLRPHRLRPRHRRRAAPQHCSADEGRGAGLRLLRVRLGHSDGARRRGATVPACEPAHHRRRQQVLLLREAPPPRWLPRLRPLPLPPLLGDLHHSSSLSRCRCCKECLPHQVSWHCWR